MSASPHVTADYSTGRVQFITHRGTQILQIDYRGGTPAEMLAMLEERLRIVTSQPKNSVRTLVDVRGAVFTRQVLERIKKTTVLERPYVRRTALVGADELPKGLVRAVAVFSLRDFPSFKTREEALDWLVED